MNESVIRVLLVAVGGALGSVSRYGLSTASARITERFPLGTLMANVIGCLIIGVLGYFVVERPALDPRQRVLLMTGFLGGLTTFSSFGYETMSYVHQSDYARAGLNVAANLVLSLAAVWAGWVAARAIWG